MKKVIHFECMHSARRCKSAVMIAFEVQSEKKTLVAGYKKTPGHLVWDYKIDFMPKATRYVAGGHTTDPPKAIMYASVVSRETIWIALFVAGLNGLNLWLTDIGNAYLTESVTGSSYVVAGDEFGPLKARLCAKDCPCSFWSEVCQYRLFGTPGFCIT